MNAVRFLRVVMVIGALVCGVNVAEAEDVAFTTNDDIATLQAVIDGLGPGDRVLLGDGPYEPSATIRLTNGVSLVGTGYEKCVIRTKSKSHVVELDHPDSTLSGVAITGGTCGGWDYGAGVYLKDGLVSQCMISNNVSTANNSFGAGVNMRGGTLSRCVITKNKCKSGAGIYLGGYNAQLTSPTLVERCLVYDNTATDTGGGIYSYAVQNGRVGSTFTLRHVTVANNTAGTIGGFYVQNVNAVEAVESCLFADNVQTISGSQTGSPNWQINGNVASSDKFKNCLFGNGSAAVGSDPVSGNAFFKSLSGGDYHLTKLSDAIDKGLVSASVGPDLDGNPVADGLPDIGCYEFDLAAEPFDAILDYSVDTTFPGANVLYDAELVNAPAGKDLSFAWTLSDGEHELTSDRKAGTFVLDAPGSYALTLKVLADGEPILEKTGERIVPIYAWEIYATPSDDLSSLVSAMRPGQILHLSEGVYPLSAAVELTVGATIVGAGREATVLDGGGAYCPVSLDDMNAVVSNLTIRAITSPNRSSCVTVSRGKLCDARVTGCWVSEAKYGMAPLIIKNRGLTDRVVIDHCTNTTSIGYNTWTYTHASGVIVENGILRNSLVCHNYCNSSDGTVFIGANTGGNGLVENCTVVDNLNDGVTSEAVAVLVGNDGCVCNTIAARNRSPNWTSTHMDAEDRIPTVSAPNWASRAVGVKVEKSYNNCWGESAESFGANCADGTKILFKGADEGDFHISVLSSCRDAGRLDASWMTDAKDLEGNPRVFHKDRVDIGCFECQDIKGLVLIFR